MLLSFCMAKDFSFDQFDTDTRGVTDTSKLIETYREYMDASPSRTVIEMVEDIWVVLDENSLKSHLTKMTIQYPKDARYYYLLGRIDEDPTQVVELSRKAIKNNRRGFHNYEMLLKTYNKYFFGTETLSVTKIAYFQEHLKKDKNLCRDLLRMDPYNRVGIAFDTNYTKYKAEQKANKKKK